MAIKINYTGAGIPMPFEYICGTCKERCEVVQKRTEAMSGRPCPICGLGTLLRYLSAPPALDADFHDRSKSHNIGWDEDGWT